MPAVAALNLFFLSDIKTDGALAHVAALHTGIQVERVLIPFVDGDTAPKAVLVHAQGQRSGTRPAEHQPRVVVNQRTDVAAELIVERMRVDLFREAVAHVVYPAERGQRF